MRVRPDAASLARELLICGFVSLAVTGCSQDEPLVADPVLHRFIPEALIQEASTPSVATSEKSAGTSSASPPQSRCRRTDRLGGVSRSMRGSEPTRSSGSSGSPFERLRKGT